MKKKTVKQILEELDPIKITKKTVKKPKKEINLLENEFFEGVDWKVDLRVLRKLINEQNALLRKNTYYTGGGFLVGGVALIISLIALIK